MNQAASKLTKEKKAIHKGDFLIDKEWWNHGLEQFGNIIKDYHQQFPDEPTMPLEEWRAKVTKRGIPSELHQIVEDSLYSKGFMRKNLGIAHEEHSLELPEKLQPIANKIITELKEAKLNPPILVELIDTPEKQQVLKFLFKSKQVIELSPKAILLKTHFDQAVSTIVSILEKQGSATSSDIRQGLDTSRKVLIPLLESMDSQGITIRDGDFRKLKKSS